MAAVDNNLQVKSLFHLKDTDELKKYLNELRVDKPGFLSWGEFLELLYSHKRKLKQPKEEESEEKEMHEGVCSNSFIVEENKRIEYHTIKEKIRSKSFKVKRTLEKTFRDERICKSKLTGEDYKKKRYKSASKSLRDIKDTTLTVPKPFRFAEREASRGQSIRQKKLEEMIDEKVLEEENMLHHKFKANVIPLSTKEPRYEQLKRKNEERRDEIKKSSIAATKARENPFSFYERDKDFYVKRALISEQNVPDEIKNHMPFKATPIPWSVSTLLFAEIMEKEENEREERIKKRSKETASQSKLPPRMDMHQKAKKQAQTYIQQELNQRPFTFQPEITQHIPDFEKQHKAFQAALEKHKKKKQATIPQPFEFKESKRKAMIMKYMDTENVPQVDLKTKSKKEISALNKPSVNPPNTEKMMAITNKTRKELNERREKEVELEKEKLKYKNKGKKVTLSIKYSWSI